MGQKSEMYDMCLVQDGHKQLLVVALGHDAVVAYNLEEDKLEWKGYKFVYIVCIKWEKYHIKYSTTSLFFFKVSQVGFMEIFLFPKNLWPCNRKNDKVVIFEQVLTSVV